MPVTHIALTKVPAFYIPQSLQEFEEFAHFPINVSGLTSPLLKTSPKEATKLFGSGGSADLPTGEIIVKKSPNTASSPLGTHIVYMPSTAPITACSSY